MRRAGGARAGQIIPPWQEIDDENRLHIVHPPSLPTAVGLRGGGGHLGTISAGRLVLHFVFSLLRCGSV